MIDRAVVERGWKSVVIAVEGSETVGRLRSPLARGNESGDLTTQIYHGLGFQDYLPDRATSAYVTLHAPVLLSGRYLRK